MKILVDNSNLSLRLSLSLITIVGGCEPRNLTDYGKVVFKYYSYFSYMLILGIYHVIQVADMINIWGNVALMTGNAFLLFTNFALSAKVLNIMGRKRTVRRIVDECDEALREVESDEARKIVKSCDHETNVLLFLYVLLTGVTVLGWAATASPDNGLPLRAWYPYDTSKSPAHELTYIHQSVVLIVTAFLNISVDTLVVSLIAQCCCRLRLTGLSLRNLCHDLKHSEKFVKSGEPTQGRCIVSSVLTPEQEKIVNSRLRRCMAQHQAVLNTAQELQDNFSMPILGQFTISMIIICFTAYELAFKTMRNMIWVISTMAYLIDMMLQVFLYCYEGNQLAIESAEISYSAYECPWYTFSAKLRQPLLIIMSRTCRITRLTAGGITTLSLASFTSIIKASYSLFTVMKQMNE